MLPLRGFVYLNQANKVGLNIGQIRTSFSNKYRHGPQSISNPQPDYVKWLKDFFGPEGKDFIKHEAMRIAKKPFRSRIPKKIEPEKTYIFEHFDSNESIKRWKPVADSDSLNGFSTSTIVRSPEGHALFKGVLDNRIPEDGVTMNSGCAGIIGPAAPRDNIYAMESCWDWTGYNCVEIKYRGDGRKYGLVLNTATYECDLQYYDYYAFPIYTRGGPYWQTVRINFTKFIFAYKGLIQDEQGGLPFFKIKFVAFTLQDNVDGPFALEIDHIGLRYESMPFDEVTPYEGYSFSHINFRPLQVDCEAPENAP